MKAALPPYHPIVSAVSVLLAAVSSALNPVIYVALGNGFRFCHRTIAQWQMAKGGSDQSRYVAMKTMPKAPIRQATTGALSLCELAVAETDTLVVPNIRPVHLVKSIAVATEASALIAIEDDRFLSQSADASRKNILDNREGV